MGLYRYIGAFLLCIYISSSTGVNATLPNLRDLKINGSAVVEQLHDLAAFSDDPKPAVTRILFTENDIRARKYIKHLMQHAGLTVTEDPMGTIYGTLPDASGDVTHGAVATGSHCDAIPLSGMYDGTVGVVGGIAALNALRLAGFKPKKPLQVIYFTSEEPTRFGVSCLGSRAMAGRLAAKDVASLRDENGTSFIQAVAALGTEPSPTVESMLEGARRAASNISYFIELHIEQGPELESSSIPIGVVTAIAAPAAIKVSFRGDGGHAGGQLMHRRNDASLAAAELALAVEQAALDTGVIDTVATAGRWLIGPNAINSVPRDASLEIDVRDVDILRRDAVVEKIRTRALEIAQKRNVQASISIIYSDPPSTCDPEVVSAVTKSAHQLGLKTLPMPSRAYHDTLFMAHIAPSGMIFIPCANGWSHRPDEFASAHDIENGIRVLAGAMATLAGDVDDDSDGSQEWPTGVTRDDEL